ncbi:MAG: hypothetical protein Q8Q35_00225, partial [Nanoarchaeota archaeon]|nr:hypothetical protein [Nanoarchaeota archaeon]
MMGEIYRNKKLLDFLYVLTQEEVALNLSKMSKIKLKDNKNITEPTIKSWFRELKKDENFFFYPIVNYEMFQLQPLFIIYERDKPIEIKEENY